MPQLSRPLAAGGAVDAANRQLVQRPLKAFVVKDGEVRLIAERARAVLLLHGPDARPTVVVSAAADEMRLTEYLEAHRALARE